MKSVLTLYTAISLPAIGPPFRLGFPSLTSLKIKSTKHEPLIDSYLVRRISRVVDDLLYLKNHLGFLGPPDQFHVGVEFPADDDHVCRFCWLKLCIIRILGTKWAALLARVILSTRASHFWTSAAAGLQRVTSPLVFTHVVTVSRSHQDKRVRRGLLCGA